MKTLGTPMNIYDEAPTAVKTNKFSLPRPTVVSTEDCYQSKKILPTPTDGGNLVSLMISLIPMQIVVFN